MFDGHLTHTSVQTIELAERENITLLKLPAHTTDFLQPLDLACFGPLKSYYEKELTARVHATGAREPLRKADFVNLLAKIWRKGLNEKNIKSGFRATGVYPTDSAKYKTERLDKVKVQTYKRWVAAGKPVNEKGEPHLSDLNEEHIEQQPELSESTVQENPQEDLSAHDMSEQPSTSTTAKRKLHFSAQSPSTSHTPPEVTSPFDLTKQLQRFAPPGMKYAIQLVPIESEISFEAVIKSRGRPSTQPAQPQKRHRISMHAAVLSSEELKKIWSFYCKINIVILTCPSDKPTL